MSEPQHEQLGRGAYDDEISLVDLWLVLVKRKRLIFGITAIAFAAGFAVALLKEPQYAYRTTLEIGSIVTGNTTRPIDNPQNALSKLQESYIPLVLHKYAKASGSEGRTYDIKASLPKNSEVLVLEGKGTEADEPAYVTLLSRAVDQIQEDHSRIVAALKKEIEIKQNSVKNDLAALDDSNRILLADKKRLEEMSALLKGQIEDTQRLLATAETHRTAALREARNEATAMTLLMLDNETRETRRLLSELQERLHLEVSRKQDDVIKALADNQRKQAETRDLLGKLELELANFRETRAVVEPMRSLKTVGTAKRTIVLLALFAGIFAGIFAAFLAEFFAKVREQTLAS